MTLVIDSGFTFDTDASTYIEAVETADGQALETATRYAINDFVIGCKQDGIWSAMKASCILAGARTLNGALVPLVGTAPTNNNFVSADYNRKSGLAGNGSTKYLDSNRANNADPQNSKHASVYATTLQTATGDILIYGSDASTYNGRTYLATYAQAGANDAGFVSKVPVSGFLGITRSSSTSASIRNNKTNTLYTAASQAPGSLNIRLYRGTGLNDNAYGSPRLTFYSIGEALDLDKLDGRVTDLMTALGAAIP